MMDSNTTQSQDQPNFFGPQRIVYDGKRMRKPIQRKTVDYGSVMIKMMEDRVYQRDFRDRPGLEPHADYIKDMLPPSESTMPVNYACKFVHTSTNKVRCPWTPEGRRLLTGSSSGEFTLWSGLTFNFETILQAHDSAVRSMIWSHNNNWMISGDHGGNIKYWQVNMNNVKAFTAHKEAVRDLSFCPTDLKFVSGSDDVTLKIWDFATCREEYVFTGHGWDVKSVDWHPQKSLIASGSKDNLIKFWDAKSGRNINTLHGHKNTVLKVAWNDNGNWLLSASRDQFLKLWDMRTMKEIQTFKGHKKEVTSCTWHPVHEGVFTSGGYDGHIYYWIVGTDEPQAEVAAHESCVWDLAWHPIGHILASGSNDHTTKFWCRNRPGDTLKDKYTLIHGVPMVVEEGEEKTQEVMQPPQASGMNLPGIGRVEYKKQDNFNNQPPPPYFQDQRGKMQQPPRNQGPPPQRRPPYQPGPGQQFNDFGNQPPPPRGPMNQGYPPQGYPHQMGMPPNMPPMQYRMPPNMQMPPNPQFMMGYPPNPMQFPPPNQQYNR